MMRLLLILVVLVAPVTAAFAAFDQPSASPLLSSCGETPANISSPAATMSFCPALIARSTGMFVELSAQRLYSLPELDSYNAAIAYSRGRFAIGGSFNSIGTNDLYFETSLGLHTAARPTRSISIGGTLSYRRVDIAEGYGSLSSLSSGVGLTTELSDQLFAYAAIDNPFEPELAAGTDIRRQFRSGIVLEDFDNVNLAMGVSLRSGNNVRYHLGETYRLSEAFTISGGIMTAPFVPSFGCSFSFNMYALSYSYRYHPDLGGTHVWGISLSR